MNNSVSYSLLKYTHSRFLGEELNVGILFVFHEQKHIEFVFPPTISRITKTYPDASSELIKSYLQSFKKRAEILNKHTHDYSFDLNEWISNEFIITDGSSLQFTKFNHALSIGEIELTIKYYHDLYLGYYNPFKSTSHKTDKAIVSDCKKIILAKRPELSKVLLADKYCISHNKIIFKPDLRWQNGTLNLIKGVSFDFSEEQYITDKALLLQNQLNHLKAEIQNKNARVDLLVSKPQNEGFLDAYNYALDILKETKTNKEIVEEKEIEHYADQVISDIEI